jgi:hypothetical protein
MTFRSGILFVLVIAGLIPSTMALAAQPPAMPPNTIDCKDWKHLRDGSWQAAANAKPFDVGTVTHMQVQDETITRHAINVGGYDLSDLLDRKCGGQSL